MSKPLSTPEKAGDIESADAAISDSTSLLINEAIGSRLDGSSSCDGLIADAGHVAALS